MSETKLLVTGGKPLYGSVRIGGAKNASYKLMLAALLADTPSRLLNFSHISDVAAVSEIINGLGGEVTTIGERALFIDPRGIQSSVVPEKYGAQGRFSSMFLPILLHKFGTTSVPHPGGDKIGKRPLDRHLSALEALGATTSIDATNIHAQCEQLAGGTVEFVKNTHTGTETVIMAAVKAKGTTTIRGAALEPEVDDLIDFLNSMGAKIQRKPNRVIEIEGVESLHGSIFQIMPDTNEAVSYACAALATKGDVILENVRAEHMQAFLEKLDDIQAGYEVGKYGIRFFYTDTLRATDTTTQIHPGFKTDWQPLWATVLTQCSGTSTIHETVMLQRFQYVPELQAMGANIEYFQPEVADPKTTYNFYSKFDSDELNHAIRITGPTELQSTTVAVKDLRHGATLTIAALAAHGTTTITGVEHIDRGYENLDGRLRALGAQIERVS